MGYPPRHKGDCICPECSQSPAKVELSFGFQAWRAQDGKAVVITAVPPTSALCLTEADVASLGTFFPGLFTPPSVVIGTPVAQPADDPAKKVERPPADLVERMYLARLTHYANLRQHASSRDLMYEAIEAAEQIHNYANHGQKP